MLGIEKLSWKEKLLGAILAIPLFYVEDDNIVTAWLVSAGVLSIISIVFSLGVDDED